MIFNVGAGGASKAEQVKYDNSTSGLNSDNVQGAVDELQESVSDLNDSLEWKPLFEEITVTTTDSGNVNYQIPSNAKEVMFVFFTNKGVYALSQIVPVNLFTTGRYVAFGCYQSSTEYYHSSFYVSANKTISRVLCLRKGEQVTTTDAKFSAYYR